METDEETDVLNQEEDINIYDDICDFDFGEEIDKLKAENKKLEEHISSLNGDIDRLNGTIAELKETQNNLTRNISALFVTAKAEIERKNRMIEELRTEVDNRQISRFNPDIKKRKDRENSPLEANKSKKFKYDDSSAKSDVLVPENNKQESKPDERQESRSKYSDRYRQVDDRKYEHRSKYSNDRYNDQFENDRYDSKFRHSNETCSESDRSEFKNKYYNDRYNNYDDDGYHSRSTRHDRYRNEIEDRYDSRSQYLDKRNNHWTNNRIDRYEMYNNRDYQYYNRNYRSSIEDTTVREREEYRGEQERYSKYADNRSSDRCDSNYFRDERKTSVERPGRSRSGTPFAPFTPIVSDKREDTSHNLKQNASNDVDNSGMNPERPRSVTPMPLPEDIEEPKPKPPKKRLKMLEEMEKKVKQNRLSLTSRTSDQSNSAHKKPPDINNSHILIYDSDISSVTSSKSTKSDKSDRGSLGNIQRKSNPVHEKVSVKNKVDIRQSPMNIETKSDRGSLENIQRKSNPVQEKVSVKNKVDIRQSPKNTETKSERGMLGNIQRKSNSVPEKLSVKNRTDIKRSPIRTETKTFKGKVDTTMANSEMESILKSIPDKNMKNKSTLSSEAAKTAKGQNSNIQETAAKNIEKDIKRVTVNTKNEIKSSAKDAEKSSLHQDQHEDTNLKKLSQSGKNSTANIISPKQNKKSEDKIKETKNQENVGSDAKQNTENLIKRVNKGTRGVCEVGQKSNSAVHKFEASHNSEKQNEMCEENSEKEIVNKGLIDTVGSKGKTEENVKMIKNKESQTTEENVKSCQKYSTRNSKGRVVACKESKQGNKNVQQTTKQNEESKYIGINKDKKQKHESIIKDPSEADKPNDNCVADEQSKENVEQVGDKKNKEEVGNKSNKLSKHSAAQDKPNTVKQDVTKEERKKDKSPRSKKGAKKNNEIIDQSKQQNVQLQNQVSKVGREEVKENLKNDVMEGVEEQLETNKTDAFQSEMGHNIEPPEDVRPKRRKSTFIEQNNDIENKINIIEEHSEIQDISRYSNAGIAAPKQDLDVPIQRDDKVTEQDTQMSSQKQIEEKLRKIFGDETNTDEQELADCKIVEHGECNNMKHTEETIALDKNKHTNEDTDKTKTDTNLGEQRNRVNVVKRRIQFSANLETDILDQNVARKSGYQSIYNIITVGNSNCDTISEVKQVMLKNSENCNNVDVPVTAEFVEKESDSSQRNVNITRNNENDSKEKNEEETKSKRSIKCEEEPLTNVKNESVSTTPDSTDSETESDSESSDDILSSVKSDNKLIEIKDVRQEKERQMESVLSLSDSSTSDDTITSNANNIKTIENKFDSLINHYIENFGTESISVNPKKVDNNHPTTIDSRLEDKNQENCLNEDAVAKTAGPKIKVLEVISIVNAQHKLEVHKSSNVENSVPGSSKQSDVEKSTIASNSTTLNSSPNSERPARRRITPTPVKDDKPLTFKNILTNTCQPETFVTTVKTIQTVESPLHLTDEGEIPILHLEENHINDLPTEVNINDKNILTLLDSMNISNIECDISKFSAETGTNPEASTGGGEKCNLTFENKIENALPTPVKSQEPESGVSKCASSCGASTSNISSNNVAGSSTQAGTTPAPMRRRRRRCWMVIKD